MVTKICFKCKKEKSLDEFYKHSGMSCGYIGKCKDCSKRDVRENYKDKKEQYSAYYRNREKTEKRKLWRFENQKKVRKNNPTKYHCRIITNNAIRDGKLTKEPCAVCGNKKVEAHHSNYYYPLDVIWLCKCHHLIEHKKISYEA